MPTVFWVLVAVASLSLGLTALFYACVPTVLRHGPPLAATPKVSILKPVKGADDDLYANLASLLDQDYPEFEVIVGAEDAADPALVVARELKRDRPDRPLVIVAGSRREGLNPKVNNLSHLALHAQYEWLLISDADVRAETGYLRGMVASLSNPDVRLVSSVVMGREGKSLGARLENLHLNTFVLSAVCAAKALASSTCVIGKSLLFRRADLEELGGFRVLGDVLAEDYVLGRFYARRGWQTALAVDPVPAVNRMRTFRQFLSRHLRWCQMRRRIAPLTYLLEPLMYPSLWLVAALGLALQHSAHASTPHRVWLALAAGFALRCLLDATLVKRVTGRGPSLPDALLSPARDLLVSAIWSAGLFLRRVSWRGNHFVLGKDSRLLPAEPNPTPTPALEGG